MPGTTFPSLNRSPKRAVSSSKGTTGTVGKLANAKKRIALLEQKLTRLRKQHSLQLQQVMDKAEKLAKRVSPSASGLSTSSLSIHRAADESGDFEVNALRKKVSELILEREELEGKLAIVQGNYAKSQERVFAAEATIAERILDNENQISDAERLIKQRDGEIIALNAKLHDYQQKTIAHKRDLSALRAMLQDANTTLQEKDRERKKLEADNRRYAQMINSNGNKKHKEEIISPNVDIHILKSMVKSLRSDLARERNLRKAAAAASASGSAKN
ncbi:hypothetical protein AAMO2058_000827400 [Amorphochlora amoebiformis]|mmetsp:Transcript_18420/g.29365  ORF Transcript_18420/g.29365 Transcript_18420/m.29365 type:complete len:273 (-) Transcript_18420:124-942(-)